MQDGRFSRQQYDAFVQQVLYRMGFSEPQFEQHAARKCPSKVASSGAANHFDPSHDGEKHVRYAHRQIPNRIRGLDDRPVAKEISVSEDDARKFFLADTARFEIPEQVKVDYVAFPIAGFLEQAVIGDEDALDYYNEHIEDYMTSETNDTLEQRPWTRCPPMRRSINPHDSLRRS